MYVFLHEAFETPLQWEVCVYCNFPYQNILHKFQLNLVQTVAIKSPSHGFNFGSCLSHITHNLHCEHNYPYPLY
jgi:hypothetical protein